MSLDVNVSEPDEFNCVELHSAIENVAKIRNIQEFSYHVDYLNGNGYIANIFRVILIENESDKRINVIVKTLINTARKELFSELHCREVKAYTQIINKFLSIQNDIKESRRLILPTCIYSSIEKGNELLIFEDLLVNGFTVNIATDKLSFRCVGKIFSELAKFHGLSFVFKKNNTELYDNLAEDFNDLVFQYSFLNKSQLKDYFLDSFEMSLNDLENIEIKNKLENIKPKLLRLLQSYVKPKQINVFCHGDIWINNILFKQSDGETKLCFLDFQTLRFANPATDIIYFLYICTDSEFRSLHLDELIKIYYDSLKGFLNLFDIDVNSLYTENKLRDDIEEYKVFGFLITLIEIKIISNHLEELNSIRKSEMDLTNLPDIEKKTLGKARINDVVTESCKNGVLEKLFNIASTI
ncbi:uncharacterized protein LOC110993782 [Pieris rapae]|uniref:uncharacterized protein LOC110993782 n=1 Tax=Pieris rapae TaxID=64459 RepID=UPI001E27DEC2|nr:uncharacterized protein LOC110993782 [Pieris rapae]